MPKVEHELDTQNFEDYEEDSSKNMPTGGNRRRTDPNFIGYTFKNFEAVRSDAGLQLKDLCHVQKAASLDSKM